MIGDHNIRPQPYIMARIPFSVNYRSTIIEKRRFFTFFRLVLELKLSYYIKGNFFFDLTYYNTQFKAKKVYFYLLDIVQGITCLIFSLLTTELVPRAQSRMSPTVQFKIRLCHYIAIGLIVILSLVHLYVILKYSY